MDLPPRLQTLLRRDDEDVNAFRSRVDAHIAELASDGWQLQTRQDHDDTSVHLVLVHPPLR
ncbi:MAG: hypothetical protein JWL76_1092 [Thermoleophilia bacterium]|nr:hypothetical protein [Thermoleophilia bacterium]